MKTTRLMLLPLLLVAGDVLAAPKAPTPAESKAVRQRIEDLLQQRRKPDALPIDPPNPFAQQNVATVGAVLTPREPSSAALETPALAPPLPSESGFSNSTEVLAKFASRLRITGLIRLKDQVHVIINDTPWKEGDFIIVERGSRPVQLQIARIQTGQLTLRLGDAELMLRF